MGGHNREGRTIGDRGGNDYPDLPRKAFPFLGESKPSRLIVTQNWRMF